MRKANESKGDAFAMVSNIRKREGLEGDASDETISSNDGVDASDETLLSGEDMEGSLA